LLRYAKFSRENLWHHTKLRNMAKMSKTAKHVKIQFVAANWRLLLRMTPVFIMLVVLSGLFCYCRLPGGAYGQWRNAPALQEDFNSDQPSWEILYIDSSGECTQRERVADIAVRGKSETYRCEFVNSGIYFLGHSILLPYMIEDLNAGIWVRSQETGMVCALEVVLPRSTGRDGKPVTMLLPGDQYRNTGEWQQLRVKADLRAMEQQAEKLRLELKVPIDTSLAYVRRLVLCCYVTGKTSRIWLDDLHADGIITISRDLREKYEEPVFNPKNILWVFRVIGLYNDLTTGISVSTEPTAIADPNWTWSRKVEQLPTISHYDPPAQSLVPQEFFDPTRNTQRQYAQPTGQGFQHDPNSSSLLIPGNPIVMVTNQNSADGLVTQPAGYDDKRNSLMFYPNDRNTSESTIRGTPGRTVILADPNIAQTSYEPGIGRQNGLGDLSSLPTARLSDRPDIYRPENAGEFPEYILES